MTLLQVCLTTPDLHVARCVVDSAVCSGLATLFAALLKVLPVSTTTASKQYKSVVVELLLQPASQPALSKVLFAEYLRRVISYQLLCVRYLVLTFTS